MSPIAMQQWENDACVLDVSGKGMQSKIVKFLVRYKWLYQKAQQTAQLRKPNGRGLSRG